MNLFTIVIAIVLFVVIVRLGFGVLRALAQPVPEPPPAGELRKVKMLYRCSLCGTEVRMTVANDHQPEPPRHCMEDMDLVSRGDL